jgi:hypothetical protein
MFQPIPTPDPDSRASQVFCAIEPGSASCAATNFSRSQTVLQYPSDWVIDQVSKLSGAVSTPTRPPSASPLPRPSGRGCSDSGSLTVTLKLGVRVPKVLNASVEDAQALLRQSGMVAAGKPVAGHHVLTQKPAAGEEVAFTKVPAATVELGLDAKVPNIPSRMANDACAQVTQADLVCDSNGAKPDSVVDNQMPAAGAFVPPGTPVKFTAKAVAASAFIVVPNVKDLGRKEACGLIEKAKLVCDTAESDAYGDEPFRVSDSNPATGAELAAGGHVTISISEAPARSRAGRLLAGPGLPGAVRHRPELQATGHRRRRSEWHGHGSVAQGNDRAEPGRVGHHQDRIGHRRARRGRPDRPGGL